ncbi:hypothetical protein HY623_00005, partial [Candidatus Uhrbacteria bacterium]|nr:hypothetical protein [Candidatus Uhrbacteria bacterium]
QKEQEPTISEPDKPFAGKPCDPKLPSFWQKGCIDEEQKTIESTKPKPEPTTPTPKQEQKPKEQVKPTPEPVKEEPKPEPEPEKEISTPSTPTAECPANKTYSPTLKKCVEDVSVSSDNGSQQTTCSAGEIYSSIFKKCIH